MYWSRWNQTGVNWLNDFNRLQNEMNHVFERLNGARPQAFPACNIWEDDDALLVEAELPGMTMDDLEVYVTQNELTIKGERKRPAQEKALQHRQERSFGSFTRTLTLPAPIDANHVEAQLDSGILKIRLGKQEQVKPRKIAVKG